jgi:hypothetical protein
MLNVLLASLALQATPPAAAIPPPVTAALAAPHYVMRASFAPDGQLEADVTILLPPGTREKSFLLARRFSLRQLDLPPGVTLTSIEPTDRPVDDLLLYRFNSAPERTGPMRIRMRYTGPINPADDSGVQPMREEGFELFIDHMWFPVGTDIQTRFTLDAELDGIAADLVPVGQGEVTRTANGVRIRRPFVDIDIPLVAMRGLQRAQAPGVEFFARDLTTPLSTYYIRHSERAARFFEQWFGPLQQTVRMAVVWRERSMAYARTGYTVFSEGGRSQPDIAEANPARHAAHEVAHAWWMLASPITDDFWLVESAAEYGAIRYIEHAMGIEEAQRFIEQKRTASADAGPVMGHGRPNRVQLYQKGPSLLVDLEQRIGRPAMDRLMAQMAREPVHTTPVFLRLLTNVADAEAAAAFQRALHS